MSYEVKKKRGRGPMVITEANAISTGRYLNRIEFRKSEKAKYLILEVVDTEGGVARKTFFEPVMSKEGQGYVDTPERLEKEVTKFVGVIESLTKALLPDTYSTGKIESFEDFCTKVQNDISSDMFEKELRIKCVYDKNGNPTLPSFGTVFEDPTKVPEDKTRMKIFERDRLVKVEMDDDNPITAIDKSDLPFDLDIPKVITAQDLIDGTV